MSLTFEIVSIEGNIGSGKSTLLSNLKKYFNNDDNIIFLKEPVEEWSQIKDENGVTILEKFYADQEKYSFSFQMMAYISRLKLIKDTITSLNKKYSQTKYKKKIIIITERSLYTDKMVFAKMLYDLGKIEHVNYQIYLNWFETFSQDYPVDKIIYVKTNPDICYERISKRSREGEDKIPLDYLNLCSEYHEKMLDPLSINCVCNKQLVLNGNCDIYQDNKVLEIWLDQTKNFINNK